MGKSRRVQKSRSLNRKHGHAAVAKRAEPHKARTHSKQDKVIALLAKADGASIEAIVKVTGWQQHSVRGFFAGVVRKKLGLTLQSDKTDGVRVYRILAAKPTKPKAGPERAAEQAGS
jgi:hypothetical protein